MKKHANDFSRQNQIGILGVHTTFFALDIFVSVFLVAQLLTVTDGNYGAVGLFYIINFTALIIVFWLFSYIIKKFSRVWCIRISTLLLFGNIFLIILLQNKLAEYYLLLSAVNGIAIGIYWCSMHTFTSEALGGQKMAGYAVWYVVLYSSIRALSPITLGAVIEFASFEVAVLIALGLCLVLLAFTILLRDQKKNENAGLSMRKFFKHLRNEGLSRRMWSQFFIQMFYGIQTLTSACVTVLIVLNLDSNFSLGALTSIFSLVAVFTVAIYKAIKSPKIKLWVYHLMNFIPLFAVVGLLFAISPATIILCQAGFLGFRAASQTELDKTRMNLMSDFGAEKFHTESLLFTEFAYYIARLAGCALLVLAYVIGEMFLLQLLVFGLIATIPLSAILLNFWNRKYISTKQDKDIIIEETKNISN